MANHHTRRRSVACLALAIAMLLLPCGGSFAETPGPAAERLVLVLDASGSMRGKIGGEAKISVARAVLHELVEDLPASAEVGLIAYGHRRDGDCSDIEVLAPVAPLDRQALISKIDSLRPKGKTPITGALLEALKLAGAEDGATTIVLVSDGLETCGGDPCKLLREAKAAGASFIVHVVGFGVEESDVSQLECTAQAGGGLYFTATNAAELSRALDRAIAAPADVPAGGIAVKAVDGGKLVDATVRIFDAGKKEEVAFGRTYSSPETNPRVIHLDDGTYDVRVDAVALKGDVRRTFPGVVVAAGKLVEKVADFGTGTLSVKVTRNGKLSDATVVVYDAGTRQQVASGRTYDRPSSNPKVFPLTGGQYDVEIASVEIAGKPEASLEGVIVESGSRVERAHDFASGTLRIGARAGSKLVDATIGIADAASGKSVAGGRTYTQSNSNPKSFELSPGRYRVRVQPVGGKSAAQETEVTVDAGKTSQKILDFVESSGKAN